MQDCKFWRVVAVVMCGGLIYIGHGLHGGTPEAAPSIVSTAKADGLALISQIRVPHELYTVAPDGKSVYSWRDAGNQQVQFVAMASTADFEAARRKQQQAARQREMQREAERTLVDPAKAGFKTQTPAVK